MKMFNAYEMKRLLAYIALFASLMLLAGCATTTPLMKGASLIRRPCVKRPKWAISAL